MALLLPSQRPGQAFLIQYNVVSNLDQWANEASEQMWESLILDGAEGAEILRHAILQNYDKWSREYGKKLSPNTKRWKKMKGYPPDVGLFASGKLLSSLIDMRIRPVFQMGKMTYFIEWDAPFYFQFLEYGANIKVFGNEENRVFIHYPFFEEAKELATERIKTLFGRRALKIADKLSQKTYSYLLNMSRPPSWLASQVGNIVEISIRRSSKKG